MVKHQVVYLSLMENLRVRRAGFAYRRDFELFLARYKSLCPNTWPRYNKANPKHSVLDLCTHVGLVQDLDYSLGK